MAELLSIYGHLVGARIRAQLEYRTSFALNTIGSFLATLLDFVAITVLFAHLPHLAGWSLHEVAFLYACSQISFALTDLLVGHFDRIGQMIRTGEMDVILIRPLGSLFQLVASDFQLRRVGKLLQGLAVLGFALSGIEVTWSSFDIALTAVVIASGSVIFTSVWICGVAVAFWTTESTQLNNAFTYGGAFLSEYPLEIYGIWVRRLLAIAIPMAFIVYFPALHLLERDDPFGWPQALRFASPLVALATAVVAGTVWRIAVRHYRSTGS